MFFSLLVALDPLPYTWRASPPQWWVVVSQASHVPLIMKCLDQTRHTAAANVHKRFAAPCFFFIRRLWLGYFFKGLSWPDIHAETAWKGSKQFTSVIRNLRDQSALRISLFMYVYVLHANQIARLFEKPRICQDPKILFVTAHYMAGKCWCPEACVIVHNKE